MPDSATPSTDTVKGDLSTVHLIIKGAILLSTLSLAAGVSIGAFTTWREGAVVLLSAPGACITGLFGLLARTRTEAQPVQVQQPANQPVPVESVDPAETETSAPSTPKGE